ncbi:hypothetical protein TNIN_484381 [Trichonephila inaurata madagascariensis]|uniref:Uncharacterized protein n=1 Tax=Trichonephila inaurata madagascariensis TaxID=2747483 RepID=A0A8X7CLA5_9ARAC|nr:hypothetical protein TNIN_484381 [Trichonephila inaurata madagascariensis]
MDRQRIIRWRPHHVERTIPWSWTELAVVASQLRSTCQIPGAINGFIRKDGKTRHHRRVSTPHCDDWLIQFFSHNGMWVFIGTVHRVVSVDVDR